MKKLKRIHPEDMKQIVDMFSHEMKLHVESNLKAKWLRGAELCEQLGLSESTLKKMRAKNQITFSRIGKVIYYSTDDIHKILERNKVDTI